MSIGSSLMSSVTKLVAHVREPLYRNGYALVLSSAATSAFGMVYWILAARFYSAEVVGINSAVLSMVMFLGGIAQFNLVNVLNRFLPRAGHAAKGLIVRVYFVSTIAAVVASLIFILGVEIWSPALGFLAASPFRIVWFTAATVSWSIFALQDGALTGLRQATWVPIEGTVFAIAKIVLLVILAKSMPQYGLLASWVISIGFVLLPINVLIFQCLIPQHVRVAEDQTVPIVTMQIVKYVSGDYVGYLLWMAMTTILPVIVVQRVGAEATAYYFLCQTIAYALYLVSRNMGMSLITEAALDQGKLNDYSYQVLVGTTRMLLPVVFVMVLGASYILRLFGDAYVTEGTTLLRLLCISAIPNIVTSLYTSVSRVKRRMRAIVVMVVSLCALILGLTYLLIAAYGIAGIGIAWLVGQTVVAVYLLLTEFRPLLFPPPTYRH